MESIQQIAEKFINKIMEVDICEGMSKSLEKMKEIADEAICRIIEQKVEEMDQAIFEHANLRKNFVAERKEVPREVLTAHGMVRFRRRYYRNRYSGEHRYLTDEFVGIEKGERIEAGLVSRLCETAVDNSYAKSSRLCCKGEVSRQTVMRKTRKVENLKELPVEARPGIREIHIQADEDHVALQDKRRSTIVKMVAIHESAEKVSSKRWRLPQRHLMSSYKEPVEDFWLRVADEIERRYGGNEELRIYIHGDGAAWIRSGVKWLKNSYFVLDKFHVSRMIQRLTGNDEGYGQYIWDQMAFDDRRNIHWMAQACVDTGICAPDTGEEFMQYIRNNWDGIRIWYDSNHHAGGSCAEGLVSHVLSSRLSSRPCGWMDDGLETISRLRVYVLNGGRITPEHIRKSRKPSVRLTKQLKSAMRMTERFEYAGPTASHISHRNSPEYCLFNAISKGGHVI